MVGGVLVPSASAQESKFMSDLRREGHAIAENCDSLDIKAIGACVFTLVTAQPIHIGFGSLAPGNGFAFGLALSERHTPNETWRITWSGDAVATFSGASRIGGYLKFIHTPDLSIVVTAPGERPPSARGLKLDTWMVDAFAQRTSLHTLDYYGIGPDTTEDGRTSYGERQTVVGTSIVLPMSGQSWIGALRPALLGGISVRSVDIRPGRLEEGPSIEQVYGAAPGLARQDAFLELREGVRLRPSVGNGRLHLNYLAQAQQFRTSEASKSSFNRWTLDLRHQIPIYRGASSFGPPQDFNGPNECASTLDSLDCPPLSRSRDRSGTIGIRVLMSSSSAGGGNQVPFYFQPTLGGSDINGERLLAGFDDYRFRGPAVLALQESLEHSVWGPIGIFVAAEQGRVGDSARALRSGRLLTSATVGVTLRAGGFPMVTLSISRGAEGHHLIGMMNTSLLGGSPRPSLD
ncbi:MAG: hypothetical protein ABS36_06145 [Acidobacteria bacterium SCN 69-37]|nr:MAG: hypothetical protein ABS36_06145 [Acidobacteria bacterium SCN 69-37]